jgi:hypothetical protein
VGTSRPSANNDHRSAIGRRSIATPIGIGIGMRCVNPKENINRTGNIFRIGVEPIQAQVGIA